MKYNFICIWDQHLTGENFPLIVVLLRKTEGKHLSERKHPWRKGNKWTYSHIYWITFTVDSLFHLKAFCRQSQHKQSTKANWAVEEAQKGDRLFREEDKEDRLWNSHISFPPLLLIVTVPLSTPPQVQG